MGIITEIKKLKNNNKADIFIDQQLFCSISLPALAAMNLEEGQEVNEDFLKELIEKQEYSSALDKALKYLGFKSCSKYRMEQYLIDKGFDKETANKVILRLEDLNLIDDKIFAERYVKSCVGKYGNGLLRYKLKELGINNEIINLVLPKNEEDSAFLMAQKYLKTKKADKKKLFIYLYNKGFSNDSIMAALSKLEIDIE